MVERSKDYALIKHLATHPAIFPHICDDYFDNPETWSPIENEYAYNLIAKDDNGAFGFGIFIPRTMSCYEAHLGFMPKSYGSQAIEAFKEMLMWIWTYTTAARVVGDIPVENRKAIKFCERIGCERYGFNPRSTLRKGVLQDQVCLGISRP